MVQRIYVNPGGIYFGGGDCYVETLLGSCVAIVFWHPTKKIGGLCHYLLPSRTRRTSAMDEAEIQVLDGRYGEEALLQILNLIERAGTNVQEYVVKVFGGGRMLDLPPSDKRVGMINARFALDVLQKYAVPVASQDVTGDGYRYLRFDLSTGDVWVRRGDAMVKEIKV